MEHMIRKIFSGMQTALEGETNDLPGASPVSLCDDKGRSVSDGFTEVVTTLMFEYSYDFLEMQEQVCGKLRRDLQVNLLAVCWVGEFYNIVTPSGAMCPRLRRSADAQEPRSRRKSRRRTQR